MLALALLIAESTVAVGLKLPPMVFWVVVMLLDSDEIALLTAPDPR